MMAERVCYTSNTPSVVLVFNGRDDLAANAQGASETRVWIVHNQHQADRRSRAKLRRQRLGAEVQELRSFISHPEFCAADRKLRHNFMFLVADSKQFLRAEGRF